MDLLDFNFIFDVDEFTREADVLEFFEQLGSGSPQAVPDASVAEDDAEHERAEERRTTLYKSKFSLLSFRAQLSSWFVVSF